MKRFVFNVFSVLVLLFSLAGCGGGGGSSSGTTTTTSDSGGTTPTPDPTPVDPKTLVELYGSQILSSNINISGMNLSGFATAMTAYPNTSSALNVIKDAKQYAFVYYREAAPMERHSGSNTIASILPKYTKNYEHYADAATQVDSYGLSDSDYLVLVTLSGGQFSNGVPLLGEIYTLIPYSDLAAGVQPKFSALGTYAVMAVQRSNPSDKNAALAVLETYANSYFSTDPGDGGVADFNSFNHFDANDTSSIKDIDAYNTTISDSFQSAIIAGDTATIDATFESDKDGDGVIAADGECNATNYQSDGYLGRDCFDTRAEIYEYLPSDRDGDFIPNDVESYVGMNPDNWDENGNGIADGIDSAYDTYYPNQWHLRSTGLLTNNINSVNTIVGNDLDILNIQRTYMGYNDGNFTAIQVVDSGVEAAHEDLSVNLDYTLSYNAVNYSNNPTATQSVNLNDPASPLEVGHGTACAGIIASRGLNAKGTRGVSPFSKISASNWLENQTLSNLQSIWLMDDSGSNAKIEVSSNSWGSDEGNYDYGQILAYDDILDRGALLRNEKGRIYLFAAGNSRDSGRDANLDGPASHHYSVTVAALDYNNSYAPYSTPGANIWLSGYSGSWYVQTPTIATTLLTGYSYYADEIPDTYGVVTFDNDSARAYTYAMNGTSAATPEVAGSLALVLEACPDLTQRDVKYLSAVTAKKVDVSSSGWVTNKAGIKYSRDYGFGLVNPEGIIKRCTNGYTNLAAENNTTVIYDTPKSVGGGGTYEITFSVAENLAIEYIYIWHDLNMRDYSALSMSLTSPNGTTMPVIQNMTDDGTFDFTSGMRFGVAGFLDENSSGTWKLTIASKDSTVGFAFNEVDLQIFGH